MAWHDNLTGVHRQIAEDPTSPLHVLAGPGTGKTFAMMRRIARLLESGVLPQSILAVTFTRTAARDLREQLHRLGVPEAESVAASTLHSLCFKILSQADVFQQTHRVPRPLHEFEVRYLELDLKDAFGGVRKVRRLIEAYEAAWARLQTDEPGGADAQIDLRFHAAIVAWLRTHRAMLIGELIPLTLNFARNNPESDLMPSFRHVLVDEYQDLNRAEQDLIDHLARNGTITVIGDDCQSIYRFRHANPEGIRTFTERWPETRSLTIDECRRCPPNVVDMSNALIAHEPGRTRDVPLLPDRSRPNAHVVIVQHRSLDEEVEAVADYVKHYLDHHQGMPAGQVLVLAPRRFIGNRIRDAIIQRRLNSLSYFQEDPLDSRSAAAGFALLSLLVDITDRPALRAWLGMASPSGLVGGYRRLMQAAEERQLPPHSTLESMANGRFAVSHTGPLLERWRELQRRIAEVTDLRGLELVRALWSEADEDCRDIRLLAETIALEAAEPAELLELLRQEITQPQLPGADGDIVRVMSLHKSKGLTAALVVVAGCMAGALPSVDSDAAPEEQEAQLREQRRLFYVAITRATDTLVLSSAIRLPAGDAMRAQVRVLRQRWENGQQVAQTAMSPFIEELGRSAPLPIATGRWRAEEGF